MNLSREEIIFSTRFLLTEDQFKERLSSVRLHNPGVTEEDVRYSFFHEFIDSLGEWKMIGKIRLGMQARGFLMAYGDVDIESGTCSAEFYHQDDVGAQSIIADTPLAAIIRAAAKVL